MVKAVPIGLEKSERNCLKAIIKRGCDWRERDGAQTISLLAAGQMMREVRIEDRRPCGRSAQTHWRRGMLVIIGNTFFFHERTAGSAAALSRRSYLRSANQRALQGRSSKRVFLDGSQA